MRFKIIKGFTAFLFLFSLLAILSHAEEITDRISLSGINEAAVCDSNLYTHDGGKSLSIRLECETPMQGIYIKYNSKPEKGILNGEVQIAENGFLHEYIELDGALAATLEYEFADICDIQVFDMGALPDSVQRWETLPEKLDILLLVAHSDDDQLFFAGLLPLYASRENVRVGVAYFVNHYDTYNRTHELLDGLWHCGIKYYPEISPFPDGYSESVEESKSFLKSRGIDDEDVLAYNMGLLENHKPLVVVLHDFKGEYGHGAHMHATQSFLDAVENSTFVPEKIYVHLYPENRITLDIDSPLDAFLEKSAFQVSQEAFAFHKSQHWTWFYSWIYGKDMPITSSSQIRSYNPSEYGLYSTLVGEDVGKNDMLENVVTYSEREARLAAEQKKEQEEASQKEFEPPSTKDTSVVSDTPQAVDAPKSVNSEKGRLTGITALVAVFLILVITFIIISARKKK